MGIFSKKEAVKIDFSTRSEAFGYMFSYMIEEKKLDHFEAAKKANEFAEIFASNMGVPLKPEEKLEGVDKYLSIAEKIGNYLDTHPKIIDYGIPVATFIAGLITERKIDTSGGVNHQNINNEIDREPIDFDKID